MKAWEQGQQVAIQIVDLVRVTKKLAIVKVIMHVAKINQMLVLILTTTTSVIHQLILTITMPMIYQTSMIHQSILTIVIRQFILIIMTSACDPAVNLDHCDINDPPIDINHRDICDPAINLDHCNINDPPIDINHRDISDPAVNLLTSTKCLDYADVKCPHLQQVSLYNYS